MNVRWLTLAAIWLAGCGILGAETQGPPPPLWFPVGEEVVYVVRWGFLPVAKTRVVSRWVEYDGRRLLSIRYRTRSNRVIATIYPVDDMIEALIDPVTFQPVRFITDMKEGRHRRSEITLFNFTEGIARWYLPDERKIGMYSIEPGIRDLVSFMYHMRQAPLVAKQTSTHRLIADNKTYDLLLRAESWEDVELPLYGKVRSLRMEPVAQFNGLFVRKGRMWIWVSDGPRRLITRITAEVPVANVRIQLCGVYGPGDDRWTQPTAGTEAACDEDPDIDRALREIDQEIAIPEDASFIW